MIFKYWYFLFQKRTEILILQYYFYCQYQYFSIFFIDLVTMFEATLDTFYHPLTHSLSSHIFIPVYHYWWSKDSLNNHLLATDNDLFKERPFLLRKIGKLIDMWPGKLIIRFKQKINLSLQKEAFLAAQYSDINWKVTRKIDSLDSNNRSISL